MSLADIFLTFFPWLVPLQSERQDFFQFGILRNLFILQSADIAVEQQPLTRLRHSNRIPNLRGNTQQGSAVGVNRGRTMLPDDVGITISHEEAFRVMIDNRHAALGTNSAEPPFLCSGNHTRKQFGWNNLAKIRGVSPLPLHGSEFDERITNLCQCFTDVRVEKVSPDS